MGGNGVTESCMGYDTMNMQRTWQRHRGHGRMSGADGMGRSISCYFDGPSPPAPPEARHLPSSACTRRREVKQGKSGGSVGTTDQGNGKGRSGGRPMGTAAYGGKGQGKGKGRGEGQLGQGGRGRSQVVRSRWAPPPMEGKGPREGQRMAIGQ